MIPLELHPVPLRASSAHSPDELETVRQTPGRKGAALVSKDMGKSRPKSANASANCLIPPNSNSKRPGSEEAAFRRRRAPCTPGFRMAGSDPCPPRPRRGLHPITRIQGELEAPSCRSATVLTARSGNRILQLRRLKYSARPSGARYADTFWLDGGNLLRTHTSPVQVRGMEHFGPAAAQSLRAACSAMKASTPATSTPSPTGRHDGGSRRLRPTCSTS
jgi:phenylalanyl-tRNA synthetase alpha chain